MINARCSALLYHLTLQSTQYERRNHRYHLGSNIVEKTGIAELGHPIDIFVRNSHNAAVGGVVGQVFGGWLFVSLLWVDKSIRGKGYGTKLMHMAEEEATSMGCTDAHLDTYSFEARPFYEKLGYELFAKLDDYPSGHCKYFLKKQLVSKA